MSLNNSKHGSKNQKNQCEIKELLYIKSIFFYINSRKENILIKIITSNKTR